GPATSRVPSLSYLNHLAGINAGTLAYSQTVQGWETTLSGGLRFVHWGTLQRRNERGERTGTFTAGDMALTLGASRSLGNRLRYGANVHLLYAQIGRAEAAAVATDLGLFYRVPVHQLTFGASLRHLGASIDGFGRRAATLPLDLQVGLSKRLAHLPLLLSLTAYDLTEIGTGIKGGSTLDHVLAHLTFGGELRLGTALRLRLGYNHRRSRDLALQDRFDFGGLGGGFGLVVGGIALDYAYNSWSELGGLHQFTVRVDLQEW
ncbi:MAG: PorV/PorQ family protein, partial [Salinibacter sp.]